jgi:hypothetical protein
MADDKLQRLEKMLDIVFDKERLTASDFEEAFKAVKKHLDKLHEQNKREIAALSSAIADALERFKADNETFAGTLSETDTQRGLDAEIRLNEAISKLDARIAAIKDGENGKDADTTALLKELAKRIPKIEEIENKLPVLGQPIRDSLELLEEGDRLKIEAVDGLREELDAIKKQAKKSGSGAVALPVSHWPIHETFTMDGIATTVTLREAIAAQGTAIFGARYNGQVLDLTTHYTVDGNKITFVGFTPEVDTIFSITYLP